MSKRIKTSVNYFIIEDTVTGVEEIREAKDNITYKSIDDIIHFYQKATGFKISVNLYDKNNIVNGNDGDGTFSTLAKLKVFLDKITGLESPIDVVLQDSTSPLIIVNASKIIVETTTSAIIEKEDYIVNVVSATGFIAGQYLTIYNEIANRVYFSRILSISVLAITLDRPIDFEYPSGSFVSVADTNMNVNGSVTPQIFGIRNPTGVDIPLAFDITRILFKCLSSTTVDLSKFGGIIGGLLRGITIRRVDGAYRNIFNAKTNADLKNIMYDFDIQIVSGNQQDGFTGRLTFAGQNKFGAVIRIGANEDLQVIIQDDLTSLVSFEMIAEGSEVVD